MPTAPGRPLRACCAALALGCASTQTVALDCIPEDVTIYVDGEAYPEVPAELELRRDRHHTLFFKGPGYRPELVVVRSEEAEGEARLEPAELCVRPVLVEVERRVQVEVADEESGPAPEPVGEGPPAD